MKTQLWMGRRGIPIPNEYRDPVPQVGVNALGLENELQRSNTAPCSLLNIFDNFMELILS